MVVVAVAVVVAAAEAEAAVAVAAEVEQAAEAVVEVVVEVVAAAPQMMMIERLSVGTWKKETVGDGLDLHASPGRRRHARDRHGLRTVVCGARSRALPEPWGLRPSEG